MATAAEIQAEIAARDAAIQRVITENEQAVRERDFAVERQRLRRVLEEKEAVLWRKRVGLARIRNERDSIDKDDRGPHGYAIDIAKEPNEQPKINRDIIDNAVRSGRAHVSHVDIMDCASAVLTGEILWTITGFSWLEEALSQDAEAYATSHRLRRDRHDFSLLYHPQRGAMGNDSQRASLAIMHEDTTGSDGSVAFRYKLMIKSKDNGFVQWGEEGCELFIDEELEKDFHLFGPDVCGLGDTPTGIFGLTHKQLTKSEWVIDDVLTIKLQIAVRAESSPKDTLEDVGSLIEEPPSHLIDNLLALLDSGANSDVTFMVQGEAFQAHSLILSAQSKVLQALFACGMQESTSKVVTIDDCEPLVFKAFLHYLYSDRFSAMEDLLKEKMTDGTSSGDSSAADSSMIGAMSPAMQQLLAIAHKYDLARLQAWCERKLNANISIDNVCSMVCQAHLYTAKNLENKCLDFIKHNMQEVITTEAFASLMQKWPQVSVMIAARLANVPEEKAAAAVDVQEKARKRKRDD